MKPLILAALLFSGWLWLGACGLDEPDYESCVDGYCCQTWCDYDGSHCRTECD